MKPDLELVQIGAGESFKAWEHGYPFHTVRWHFHPEFELHQVHATSGRYFVGDFVGSFEPGNLVLVGPNLPHNWVSDLPEGVTVPLRNRVMQFSAQVVDRMTEAFPEIEEARSLFERSRAGVVFSPEAERAIAPLFGAIVAARGVARIALFLQIIEVLVGDAGARTLTTPGYFPDPSGYMSHGLNAVLAHINTHLTEPLHETALADIAGMTPAALSRSFRRHTGQPLTKYVNRLRVNLASQLLMSPDFISVADVCFASGFNNLSNFNRQFLAQRGMTPSQFRRHLAENKSFGAAA
jgi:AraC-like DNA-binding protein